MSLVRSTQTPRWSLYRTHGGVQAIIGLALLATTLEEIEERAQGATLVVALTGGALGITLLGLILWDQLTGKPANPRIDLALQLLSAAVLACEGLERVIHGWRFVQYGYFIGALLLLVSTLATWRRR